MTQQFGHTWWGRAWIDALENQSRVDPRRLARGRTYARQDRVTSLSLSKGEVVAGVRGSHRLHYRTRVQVRTYGDEEWAKVMTVIASRAGHLAALLDGDLEPAVLDDAREAGIELLPSRGDLKFRCSCPDTAVPCKHAAAVCYLVAEALDDDPFTLFALRGRERVALLDGLRAARHALTAGGTDTDQERAAVEALVASTPPGMQADEGEVARDAWAREHPPLPPLPDVPGTPGTPAAWPTDPPPDAPFDTPGLLILATDATHRAWAQLRGEDRSGLALSHQADLARREATDLALDRPTTDAPGSGGAGRGELAHRALAWHHGGQEGLAMLDEAAWRAPVATMAAGRAALEDAGITPSVLTITNNRITAPGFQLRFSRAGQWWRFEKRRGRWEVAAPPAESADDLLDP